MCDEKAARLELVEIEAEQLGLHSRVVSAARRPRARDTCSAACYCGYCGLEKVAESRHASLDCVAIQMWLDIPTCLVALCYGPHSALWSTISVFAPLLLAGSRGIISHFLGHFALRKTRFTSLPE